MPNRNTVFKNQYNHRKQYSPNIIIFLIYQKSYGLELYSPAKHAHLQNTALQCQNLTLINHGHKKMMLAATAESTIHIMKTVNYLFTEKLALRMSPSRARATWKARAISLFCIT